MASKECPRCRGDGYYFHVRGNPFYMTIFAIAAKAIKKPCSCVASTRPTTPDHCSPQQAELEYGWGPKDIIPPSASSVSRD